MPNDFKGFAAMPHEHMFVMAQLILDVATADINKADEIRFQMLKTVFPSS
jgi:hypothetical protein